MEGVLIRTSEEGSEEEVNRTADIPDSDQQAGADHPWNGNRSMPGFGDSQRMVRANIEDSDSELSEPSNSVEECKRGMRRQSWKSLHGARWREIMEMPKLLLLN